MDQDETGFQVGLGPGNIVLDGDPAPPPPKGHNFPIFGPYLLWPNCYMDQDATCREVGLGPSDIVLDGDPSPSPPKRDQIPLRHFLAHVYCGQMAEWIKMPLGIEVGLGPGNIVLDADPAPPPTGTVPPLIFGPCLLWPNGHPSQLLLSTCQNAYSLLQCLLFPHSLPTYTINICKTRAQQ